MSEVDSTATSWTLDWAYQQQAPQATAQFKQQPEDFGVVEVLGFEPTLEPKGQHHWLWVEKRGANTEFVARELANFAGVHPKLISFSGLKDRHAVTQQWFSVELPATQEVDWQQFSHPEASILRHVRSVRKLKRGTHAANQFTICLRAVSDKDDVEARLIQVQQHGVPNYFGEQRFGHRAGNLDRASAMFAGKRVKDRNLRSILLSAARSYVFNQVVSARLNQGLATRLLDGDVCMLRGTQSFFCWQPDADDADSREAIEARLASGDLQLSAPLWGRGRMLAQQHAAQFEQAAIANLSTLCEGLEKAGLKQEGRALQLAVEGLTWAWQGDDLTLSFELPAGAFATSVLREIVQVQTEST